MGGRGRDGWWGGGGNSCAAWDVMDVGLGLRFAGVTERRFCADFNLQVEIDKKPFVVNHRAST